MPEQYRANRRPGILPGRRLAYALTVLALLALEPGAAAAQTVVSATVYDPPQKTITHPSVSLSTLEGCPLYSGPSPLTEYPSGLPYQPSSTSSWAVSDVLTCGFQIPLADVSGVSVLSSSTHSFETPLSAADLGPGPYQDPAGSGTVPLISVDGTENQTTYFRPYRGAGDANGTDEVVEQGAPISLILYENGPPLRVTASARALPTTSTASVPDQLSATVHDGSGATVPASALRWSWTFGDGAGSSQAAPRHSFAAGSSYAVTVQVSDPSAGTGGTETITISPASHPKAGPKNEGGAGNSTKPKSETGSTKGKGGGSATPKKKESKSTTSDTTGQTAGDSSQTTTNASSQSSTTSSETSGTSTPETTSTTAPAASHPRPRPPRRHPTRRIPSTAPAVNAPIVTGLLISDVKPLSASVSPLVHRRPAATRTAAVHAATRTSSLAAPAAVLAVVLLLALGAAGELRGARRWRSLHQPA